MSTTPGPSASGPKQRIVLVDDHGVLLEGYRLMLSAQPDLAVCATASSAPEALDVIAREKPDLVVTDLTMAGRSGLDLIKDLIVLHPGVKILVCSMHDETLYAERTLRAGARGYVMKDTDGPTFLRAIRCVLSGQVYVSSQLAATVIGAFATGRQRGTSSSLEKLSDRELEVFRMFGEGQTAKEIAGRLNLSPKTVAVHRDHIKEKLGFPTSAEMIRQAVRFVESSRVDSSDA